MSPKSRQPIEDEPDDLPEIPADYVRMTRPSRPKTAEPVKRKASFWWGVAGFVVAVAAVITVIVVVSLPDPQAAPDTTAKAVAEALTAHDLAKVDSYLCDNAPRSPEITAFYGTYGNASVVAVENLDATFANATLRSADRPGVDLVLQMTDKNDSWCVFAPAPCNVLDNSSGPLFDEVCRDRPRA